MAGAVDPSFEIGSGIDRVVNTASVQADGKIIIGGYFSTVRGAIRYGIARLNSDGTVDPGFDPGTGIEVPYGNPSTTYVTSALVLSTGKILLIGTFEKLGGLDRRFVGRLSANGSVDRSFDPGAGLEPYDGSSRASGYCLAELQDGRVLAGGHFRSVNGIVRPNLVRLNDDGSVDPTFVPASNEFEWIYSLAVTGDKILVLGESIGTGPNRMFIRRLNLDGSLDLTFNPPTEFRSDRDRILVQRDGKIIVPGGFGPVGSAWNFLVTRLNANGTLDESFHPNALATSNPSDIDVSGLVLQSDGKIVVGGTFLRLNSDGSLDPTFKPERSLDNSSVIALQPDGKVLVKSSFGPPFLRRLNLDGSLDSSFQTSAGANSTILSVLEFPDGKVLIGGAFTNVNGVKRNYVARLNRDGSLDASFESSTELPGPIDLLAAQPDGKVLAAGDFPNRIVRLNLDGSVDSSFNLLFETNGRIESIGLREDGKILLGGSFSIFNGANSPNIVQLNPDGTVDPNFIPASPDLRLVSSVKSLALQNDGKVIIGGTPWRWGFTDPCMARLNKDGSLDRTFAPALPWVAAQYPTIIQNLAIRTDGKIMVQSPRGIVRLNPDGSRDATFNADRSALFSLYEQPIALQSDGKLIVATELDAAIPIRRVTRLDVDGAIDPFFQQASFDNRISSLSVQRDGRVLVSGFFNIANGVATTFVTRLTADFVSALPMLKIQRAGTSVDLRWLGTGLTLESAPSITGPFTALTNAISPHVVSTSKRHEFFRLTEIDLQPGSQSVESRY